MKLYFKILLAVLITTFTADITFAQQKPFWNEIRQFQKKDSVSMPTPGGIVFVGSSSFTMWKDLETVYKDYNAINRGFGGSNLVQANMYIKDLVLVHKPRQVVIYSGENDVAEGESAVEVLNRFAAFFTNLRNNLPDATITYISMKASPSREKMRETMNLSNKMIREFLTNYRNTAFVNVDAKMHQKDGSLRPDLFLGDMLHMKPAGYTIWIKEITPFLKK